MGTDKAVSPLNTYGATKLLMEKLFVNANNYLNQEKHKTKFIAVRYGNVLGSSGSVIPRFIDLMKNKKPITITDLKMTRFTITMNEALDFILKATEIGKGSEIFIPKLNAYDMELLIESLIELLGETERKIIGIRPGEKLHETLINSDEMRYGWEIDNLYMISNPHYELFNDSKHQEKYENIKKIENMNSYTSDIVSKISKNEFLEKIKQSGLI